MFVYFFRVFFQVFFDGNRNSTEKIFFFATTVKLNSQNNCITSFSFRWYKEKQVVGSCFAERFIFGYQKNAIKCNAFFPQWNLKRCKFYGVWNIEEQFDFPRKLIPVAHRFLEKALVAADYYHNHILISKKCYQLPMNFRRKVDRANVLIQNNLRPPTFSFRLFLCFTFSEKQKLCAINIDL